MCEITNQTKSNTYQFKRLAKTCIAVDYSAYKTYAQLTNDSQTRNKSMNLTILAFVALTSFFMSTFDIIV